MGGLRVPLWTMPAPEGAALSRQGLVPSIGALLRETRGVAGQFGDDVHADVAHCAY
jgi:hypothetical protein